jgi:hypothetical protein
MDDLGTADSPDPKAKRPLKGPLALTDDLTLNGCFRRQSIVVVRTKADQAEHQ